MPETRRKAVDPEPSKGILGVRNAAGAEALRAQGAVHPAAGDGRRGAAAVQQSRRAAPQRALNKQLGGVDIYIEEFVFSFLPCWESCLFDFYDGRSGWIYVNVWVVSRRFKYKIMLDRVISLLTFDEIFFVFFFSMIWIYLFIFLYVASADICV